MISSGSKDQADFTTKQEGSTSDNNNNNNISKHINPSTSTSSWSRLKDPRIVRVSRAFGGKDRHSKVYTVRGLRDRRVRLSVPTAIQLYDLQDRLGLNQPSKVVDWLLNAAKNEIDQLPPLQIPPGSFGQNLESPPDKLKGLKMSNWDEPLQLSRSAPSSSLPSALLNNVVPNINPFLRWDPSSLSLSSQFGTPHHQSEDVHDGFSDMPMPNQNLSGSHQLLVYPPQTQPYFPSHVTNASGEINFQMLRSSTSTNAIAQPIYSISQGMRPNFHLSMNPNFFPSQNNSDNETNKDS